MNYECKDQKFRTTSTLEGFSLTTARIWPTKKAISSSLLTAGEYSL